MYSILRFNKLLDAKTSTIVFFYSALPSSLHSYMCKWYNVYKLYFRCSEINITLFVKRNKNLLKM